MALPDCRFEENAFPLELVRYGLGHRVLSVWSIESTTPLTSLTNMTEVIRCHSKAKAWANLAHTFYGGYLA